MPSNALAQCAGRGRGDRHRQIEGAVLHGGRRAILAFVAEHIEARAAGGVLTVAVLVENVRAKLDRVGAADLLLRES